MEKPGLKPAEMLFPGRVTQVNDPHYFWMQMGSMERLGCFLKIQRDMQTFCENQWLSVTEPDSIMAGQLVLVNTGQIETCYRRAQVTRVISDTADVFFIDFGNTELVTLDQICVEFPPIVRSVPPMAVRCCMAGIKPIAKSWTSRGVKTFTRLTSGCTLQTLVIYADPGYLLVSLYGRDGSNPRSIAHHLLDEDVALPIENNEVPEYVSEIPAFMALLQPPGDPDVGVSDERGVEDSARIDVREPPSSPTKSEKYIPPGRKQSGSSPGSATRNGPVHDFFPFENVSTYPPTPSDSPTKPSSVGKGSSPGSSEGSYFSRSPGRADTFQSSYDRPEQLYSSSPEKNVNGYRKDYTTNNQDWSPQKASQASESPRNSNSYETPSAHSGSVYGNSRNSESITGGRGYSSSQTNSPVVNKLHNGSVQTFMPPFFQPKQPFVDVTQMNFSKSPSHPPSLTPPSAYEQHTGYNRALTPPGYYESHKTSNSEFNQGHSYEDNYSTTYDQSFTENYNNSSGSRNVSNSYEKTYPGSYVNSYSSRNDYYRDSDRNKDRFKESPEFVRTKTSPSYAEEKTKGNLVRLQIPDTSYPPPPLISPSKQGSYPGKSSVPSPDTLMTTPSKAGSYGSRPSPDSLGTTPSKAGSYGSKPSPESPAIANFDMNDIEHTMHLSTQCLHQKNHQQTLMALHEEAEDIARESQEQYKLVKMSRFGRSDSDNLADDYKDNVVPDVFDKISEEIRDASFNENMQFYEEMRKSPVKRRPTSDSYNQASDKNRPIKLEEMPQNYIADIDFSVAVKEALESSKTDGMENAKALLDAIIESLKAARVEKQLYDVIALLLLRAIQDYNLYHLVVMDTISKLNDEFDIKDTLAKALKKQQELHVRVPIPKAKTHLDFSKVQGLIYNMSLDWKDSNSSIQDAVLSTVEKWIVFNNKGTQLGQTDKENMFLDCFSAFWEVSSDQLRKHNHSYYTRLQEEVKKKLLNDNVTRSIKERLLGILLEMFSYVEMKPCTNVFTQTTRRTMIPSSCQVKPSCCDKGTMTEDEDVILYNVLYSQENRMFTATESATPEVSLRPAKSWGHEVHSTPSEELKHSSDVKQFDENLGATSFYSENSYQESSCSIYETPNESLVDNNRSPFVSANNSMGDSTVSRSHNTQVTSGKDNQSTNIVKPEKLTSDQKLKNTGKSKSWASVASSDVKEANVRDASAKKANIVDWFEYNPEPEPTKVETVITKKDTSKKSNKSKGSKSAMSLSQLGKHLESHSMVKQEPLAVKKEQSKIKSKHLEVKDTERKQHHESVAEKLAKNTELEKKSETQKCENKSGGNHENKSVNIVPAIKDIHMQNTESNSENIDWWGDSDRNKVAEYKTGEIKEVMLPPEEVNRVHDEFGFQSDFTDDDDDEWETHSDSDAVEVRETSQKQSNYDTVFPPSDSIKSIEPPVEPIKPPIDYDSYDNDFPSSDLTEVMKAPADFGASSEVVNSEKDLEYEREFPPTDLATYIAPPEPVVQETGARWVPGVRRCTLCGDREHTANDCPEKASKLFL